jgi:hypothetical protein
MHEVEVRKYSIEYGIALLRKLVDTNKTYLRGLGVRSLSLILIRDKSRTE